MKESIVQKEPIPKFLKWSWNKRRRRRNKKNKILDDNKKIYVQKKPKVLEIGDGFGSK